MSQTCKMAVLVVMWYLKTDQVKKAYPDNLVFGTRGKVAAIGAEADAPDVKVSSPHRVSSAVVLENADLLSSADVKDLGGPVAASSDVLAVLAEADAANNAVVLQRVDQVDVENALDLGVEDGMPVAASLLVVGGYGVEVEFTESVADRRRRAGAPHASVVGGRLVDLRRLSAARVRDRRVDLGRSRSDTVGRASDTAAPRTRRRSALRGLRCHAVRHGGLGVRLLVGSLLLLSRGMGRHGQAGRGLSSHLVLVAQLLLGRAMLLVLLLLWRGEAALVAAGHDSTKKTVAGGNRRRLRGSRGLGRASHGRLSGAGLTTRRFGKLVSENAKLLLVPRQGRIPAC